MNALKAFKPSTNNKDGNQPVHESDKSKPVNPLVSDSLIKYEMLKGQLFQHFFQEKKFNLTLKEYSESYSKPYQLLNNSNLIIANDKKYRNVQDSFLEKYQNDLTTFAVKIYDILSKIKGSKPNEYIAQVCKLINVYTRINHWIYRTFMFIQRNAIRAQGTKLYFTGVKILKTEIMEKIYEDLYEAINLCLESYKEANLGQLQPLQIVIKFIGIIGFTKFKLVDMAKIATKYEYISNRKEGDQSPQNPYDTAYFKKNFIGRLAKDIKKKYTEIVISMMQLSVPQYFQKAKKIIQIEEDTANHFYSFQATKEIVIRIVLQTLIVEKAEFLLKNPKSGMSKLMKQKDIKNLVQIFDLLKKSNMTKVFFKEFQNYIHTQGEQILNKISPEDEKTMKKQTIIYVLGQIIQFNEFVDRIRYDIDENDADLQKAQNAGFQAFCNIGNKVCNFLAYYADLMLKKDDGGVQGTSEDIVNQIKKISKYLYSYDYFLKMHQKLLGLRILYDNFKNQEAEYALIGMLKSEAGLNATSKLSNMITDQKSSQSWNIQLHLKNKFGFGFEVMMLTSGSWQINDPKCGKTVVPKQLLKAVDEFQQKFLQKMPNRSISWIFTHGRAVIQFINTANTKYIVVLNNYQLLTLLEMQNNNFSQIKFGDLLSKLKIQDQNFYKSSLLNLLKYGILVKDGNPAKIQSKGQTLRVNFDFKYKTQKVGCSIIPKYTQKMQNLGVEVSAERCILIDANLVKIMKQKRRCPYNELIIEVQNMCKTFKAEVSQIKLRIQNCIQRQFFQRDSKDMNVLIYKP